MLFFNLFLLFYFAAATGLPAVAAVAAACTLAAAAPGLALLCVVFLNWLLTSCFN